MHQMLAKKFDDCPLSATCQCLVAMHSTVGNVRTFVRLSINDSLGLARSHGGPIAFAIEIVLLSIEPFTPDDVISMATTFADTMRETRNAPILSPTLRAR